MNSSFGPRSRLARRVRRSACALLLSASTFACRSTTQQSVPPPMPVEPMPVVPEPVRTPAWVGEPLSWEKLKEIESWIASQGEGADPYWKIEGELQLNQGRLEFARRESGGQKVAPDTVKSRIQVALAGFRQIAADESASPSQKRRAQDGIARCQKSTGVARSTPVAALAMVSRAQWGAMTARYERMEKNKGGWTKITVHHSAEREPPPLDGSLAESAAAVRSIQKAHMEGKETGFGDIGYHFVIDPYGKVFQGRDLAWQGAHAYGDNNIHNIGVCLIGNFDVEKPTKAALDALAALLDDLRAKYKIARSSVFTHHELKATECPGRNLIPWVERYRRN
jgi:hypothetical protein